MASLKIRVNCDFHYIQSLYCNELGQRRMITEILVERNLYKGTQEQK